MPHAGGHAQRILKIETPCRQAAPATAVSGITQHIARIVDRIRSGRIRLRTSRRLASMPNRIAREASSQVRGGRSGGLLRRGVVWILGGPMLNASTEVLLTAAEAGAVELEEDENEVGVRPSRTPLAPGGDPQKRARPEQRAEHRLAAAVPALDRPRAVAERRGGGVSGQAHRARRRCRQEAHDRGQPETGRVDLQGLHGARHELPRPDPGGLAGADPGGGEVRLSPRLQVLHVRHLVDSPVGDPRDRRQGPHDPYPGAHGGPAQQGASTPSEH